MDRPRQLLVAACSSLSRLQLRLLDKQHSADYTPGKVINRYPHWTVADIDPPSVWLRETAPHMSLSGAIRQTMLMMAHLLAMIEAPGEINALEACVVLQALSSMAWSPVARRLAEQLGVDLPAAPLQATLGAQLSELGLPPVRSVGND